MSRNKTWPIQRHQIHEFCLVALRHYGDRSQADKCIEECRELDDALIVWKRGGYMAHDCPGVLDEIADVIIMVEQMRIAFGAKAVDDRIAFKIERQRQRMQGGE